MWRLPSPPTSLSLSAATSRQAAAKSSKIEIVSLVLLVSFMSYCNWITPVSCSHQMGHTHPPFASFLAPSYEPSSPPSPDACRRPCLPREKLHLTECAGCFRGGQQTTARPGTGHAGNHTTRLVHNHTTLFPCPRFLTACLCKTFNWEGGRPPFCCTT